MGKSVLFLRGIPTEPDVITLLKEFGVPEEGTPIAHQEIADVLNVPVKSFRFQTVTSVWRKRLRADHQMFLKSSGGQFTVRVPSERVELQKTKVQIAVRSFSDSLEIGDGTDRERLTDRERADADKLKRIASLSRQAAIDESKKRSAPQLRAVASASGGVREGVAGAKGEFSQMEHAG